MIDRGLLDTSVLIASESGRPLDVAALPEHSAISVVTLAELRAGVLAARDTETRARRMVTLDILTDIEVLPIDEAAALVWARLRLHLAEHGGRAGVNDVWIAATAVSRDLPVVTQDADFDALDGVAGLRLIRV